MNDENAVGKQAAGASPAYQAPNLGLMFALAGGGWLAFQLYVLAAWMMGPNFKPTDPGADPISSGRLLLFDAMQTVVPLLAIWMIWKLLLRPWLRSGQLNTDGRILFAAAMIFFWDMSLNYSSIALFYNSNLINMGAWANGAWPGWYSPTGHRLPEPIVFIMPAYLVLVFSQAIFLCFFCARRRPAGHSWACSAHWR